MKKISFEKLRAAFFDASFILVPHNADCTEFYHAFQFDFYPQTISRAWEKLDRAKAFIKKIRPEYLTGKPKLILDGLDQLIVDSYCRIAVETSTTGTTCNRLIEGGDEDFLF